MSEKSKLHGGVEATASADDSSNEMSRRSAMSVMAKYGAATAPVMLTLFQGQRAAAAGSGASVDNGDLA